MKDESIEESLSAEFTRMCAGYGASEQTIKELWQEILEGYNSKGRYYHTLDHLHAMSKVLHENSPDIRDMTPLLFALFYHDIVYDPLRSDNEEKSAKIAVSRVSRIGVNRESLEVIRDSILATKGHRTHENSDINYFLDADLAVLGSGKEEYQSYSTRIRKEFAIIPDLLYKPGRRKVLRHFLATEFIYKTHPFRLKYEEQARANILLELENLG